MNKIISIILLTIIAFHSFGKEPGDIFENANKNYQEKNFTHAIEDYGRLVDEGYVSSELFFNLGNAYFKTNNIANAIINYERAKLLSPDDEDILFNLKLANLRIVDKIEPVPELFILKWLKNIINGRTADQWATWAVVFLWVTFSFGCLFLFFNQAILKRIGFFIGVIFLLLTIISVIFGIRKNRIDTIHPYAIVFVQNSYIKSAPDFQSTDLFILHEGVKVQIVETTHEWNKIKLADGKVGWIKSGDLVEI